MWNSYLSKFCVIKNVVFWGLITSKKVLEVAMEQLSIDVVYDHECNFLGIIASVKVLEVSRVRYMAN